MTIRDYPLVCGTPREALAVSFPAAVTLRRTIPADSVHVNGKPAASVTVHGRNVTVAVPPTTGVTCQSITLGRVTLAFGTGAGIDALRAGSYAVTVRSGTHRYKATLTLHS